MDRKYWQFRQNIMSAAGEGENLDNDQSQQIDGLAGEIQLINKLKGVAQQRLIVLLKEYGEVKQTKSP